MYVQVKSGVNGAAGRRVPSELLLQQLLELLQILRHRASYSERVPTGLRGRRGDRSVVAARGASVLCPMLPAAWLRSQARSSGTGTGREMWKPCPRSQPSARNQSSAAESSTPSATMGRLRVWASSMVERTIAALWVSVGTLGGTTGRA
jgi:hypothetical protein